MRTSIEQEKKKIETKAMETKLRVTIQSLRSQQNVYANQNQLQVTNVRAIIATYTRNDPTRRTRIDPLDL